MRKETENKWEVWYISYRTIDQSKSTELDLSMNM